MNSLGIKLIALSFLYFGLSTVKAQNAISVAGGEASGVGGKASYTIGQVVYTTNTGSNASVAQGVQQAYTISVETSIDELKNINLICTAYPNPTTGYLTLKIENSKSSQLFASLHDIYGRFLMSKIIDGLETLIPMETYVAGTYLLKVSQSKDASSIDNKTFKIIKK